MPAQKQPRSRSENESNLLKLYGATCPSPYVKDAFHRYLIEGETGAVNPANAGTKAAAIQIGKRIQSPKAVRSYLSVSVRQGCISPVSDRRRDGRGESGQCRHKSSRDPDRKTNPIS